MNNSDELKISKICQTARSRAKLMVNLVLHFAVICRTVCTAREAKTDLSVEKVPGRIIIGSIWLSQHK